MAARVFRVLLLAAVVGIVTLIGVVARPWLAAYAMLTVAVLYPPTIQPIAGPIRGLAGSLQLQILLAALALAGLLGLHRRARLRRGELAPFLLLAGPAISALVNGRLPGLRAGVLPFLLVAAATSYGVALARRHPDKFRALLVVVAVTGAGETVIAAWQFAGGSWGIYDQLAVGRNVSSAFEGRSAGTLGHPTILGAFTAGAAVIAATLRPRWWVLLLVANLIGLAMSGARVAWLAVLVGLLFAALFTRSSRLKISQWAVVVGSFIVGAGVFAVLLVPAVATAVTRGWSALAQLVTFRLQGDTAAVSVIAHQARVDAAWQLITDGPVGFLFGHGPGASTEYLLKTRLGDEQAATFDNTYLTLWVDFGLVTLVLAAALLVVVLRHNWRATAPIVVIAVVFTGFDSTYWGVLLVVLGFCLAGAHTAAVAQGGKTPLPERAPSRA